MEVYYETKQNFQKMIRKKKHCFVFKLRNIAKTDTYKLISAGNKCKMRIDSKTDHRHHYTSRRKLKMFQDVNCIEFIFKFYLRIQILFLKISEFNWFLCSSEPNWTWIFYLYLLRQKWNIKLPPNRLRLLISPC